MTTTRPARRRPKPLLVAGVGVLVVAGALAGATAVTAGQTQGVTEELLGTLRTSLEATGLARVEGARYERGLLSSTQHMTVVVGPEGTDQPVRLLVTHHIQHGPLPGLRAVGRAVIDTDVRLADARAQAQVERAFGGKKPQLHTVVGLGGGVRTTVDVPAGRVTQEGTTVVWKPLTGRVDVDGPRSAASFRWPGLQVTGLEGGGELSGLSVTSDTRRSGGDDRLGTGLSSLTVDRVTLRGEGQEVNLRGLNVSGDGKPNGPAHYDASVRYRVAELAVTGRTLRDVQLGLSVRHLARAPLNRLTRLTEELRGQTTPEFTPEQERRLEADLLALLRDAPEVRVDRLSVSNRGGDIVLSGRAGLPGLRGASAEQVRQLTQAPALALGALDLRAELRAGERAVEELGALLGTEGAGQATALVRSLTESGYVRRDGDRLSADVQFKEGALSVNGQALGAF